MKPHIDKQTLLDRIKASPCASLNSHLFVEESKPVKKKSKYGNEFIEVLNKKFRSKKEGNRYFDLHLLELSGFIKDLRLQVPYQLNDGGTHSLVYQADFVYFDVTHNKEIVEDSKGYRNKVYLKKKALMLKLHNIKIYET